MVKRSNAQFSPCLHPILKGMGLFVDVVRGVSVSQSINYVSYLFLSVTKRVKEGRFLPQHLGVDETEFV